MFRTTSPSYPVMASVEYGVKYFANNPQVYKNAKSAAENFKNSLKGFTFYPSDDWCKIAVDFQPLGISAESVTEYLESENIHAEMCDGRYILFYISPLTTAESLQKLADVLRNLKKSNVCVPCHSERSRGIPREKQTLFGESFGYGCACAQGDAVTRGCSYLQAVSQPWEYAALDDAAGRVCAENAGLTPPCTPLITAGEIFTREAVEILKRGSAFGVTDGKVKVVKK